jgi:hypothetical protein
MDSRFAILLRILSFSSYPPINLPPGKNLRIMLHNGDYTKSEPAPILKLFPEETSLPFAECNDLLLQRYHPGLHDQR